MEIPFCEKYDVSELGLVTNKITGKVLKSYVNENGYHRVSLTINGKTKSYTLHRLVLLAFKGECPHNYEGHHIDKNKDNNTISNLDWVSHRHHVSEEVHSRRIVVGSKSPNAKLKEPEVQKIRQKFLKGVSVSKLSREYKVSCRNIGMIVRKETWRHVNE